MIKFSSKLWVVLVFGMPLMSPAQKCSISPQDENRLATLSKGNLNFALNTYKGLANEENVFFSPFSISVALAMTAAGAGGHTLTQMKDVLNLNDFTDDKQIGQAFQSLLESICSNSNYTLSTANKIFLQKNFPFLKPFIDTLTSSYKSSAENVDYKANADGVAKLINSWVEKQTDNNIKDILQPGTLDALTVLVLVNAIYFKGTWQKRFEPKNTKPEDFTLANGQKVSVPMMNIRENLKYHSSSQLKSQILQLNYAGDRLVMYIILPEQNNGLTQLQQQLTPDVFNSLRQNLFEEVVIAKIPKFRLNFRKDLIPLLKGLGMTDIFGSKANLTRMSDRGDLYVTDVIHQAFVEVDEKGTTAAAATVVVVGERTSHAIRGPESFIADHPFIFVIYDTLTSHILFMGNVNNPKA